MLVILTNLLPAPSDSCLTCLIYTSIACHIKPEAELQNFQLHHLFSNAFQLSCAVTIDSSAERGFIPWRASSMLPPLQPIISPLLLPRVPLQLVMPWMETGSAPLALPSGGLWLPLMKLALMDLDKSQEQVNFNGFLWENCL